MDTGYWILDIPLSQGDSNTQYRIPNIEYIPNTDYLATKDLVAFVKFLVVKNVLNFYPRPLV